MTKPYDPFDHPYLSLAGETRCRVCLLQDHEESALTDQNDDGVDWGDMPSGIQADSVASWTPEDVNTQRSAMPSYPEYPPLPEAPISINFKVTGEPMITVRAYDAQSVTALLNDLEAGGVWANIAAAQASLKAQGMVGGLLGPVSPVPPQAAPQGPPQGFPGTPPPFGPNVSVPNAPGFQPQQSYQSGPPQGGGWGGNAGGGSFQDSGPQAKPQPPGWMRVNARSGPGFDTWKQLREQHKDNLKGKISWGGKSDFWIEPSIAQWLAQQGFAVTP